jgi:hypothetical protein
MTPTFFDFFSIETFVVRYAGQDAICLVLRAENGEGDLEDTSAMEEVPEIRIVVSIVTGKILVVTADGPVVESVH